MELNLLCQLEKYFTNSILTRYFATYFFRANHYICSTWEEQTVNQVRLHGRNGRRCTTGYMAYTPQHIANYFLDRADDEYLGISQMKLQKLVYIAYGWNLAVNGTRLFHESIEAWDHGPVIPSLYHEFKHFKSDPIDEWATQFDLDTFEEIEPVIDEDDLDTNIILDYVWESYKKYSSAALRRKTHEADTPWSRVYNPSVKGVKLKDEDIGQHFKDRIWEYIENSEDDGHGKALAS